jgi:hypothetical protein
MPFERTMTFESSSSAVFGEGGAGHDPAAAVFAFGFEIDSLAFLQQFEGGGPRPKWRWRISDSRGRASIDDAEPQHGVEMVTDDFVGDEGTDLGQF